MISLSIETQGAVEGGGKATAAGDWSQGTGSCDSEAEENESLLQSSSSSRDITEEGNSLLVNERKDGRLHSVLFLIASLTMALVIFQMSRSGHESSDVADNDIHDINDASARNSKNATTMTNTTKPYSDKQDNVANTNTALHNFKEIDNNNNNNNKEHNNNHTTSNETVVLKDAIANDPSLLENPIIQILQVAKVHNLTLQEFQALPQTARNFQTLYHNDDKTTNSPIIIGLERCKEYRDHIAPDIKDRYAAAAGMFNTGNNAFDVPWFLIYINNNTSLYPSFHGGDTGWNRTDSITWHQDLKI